MASQRDYYELLGVSKDASEADIKRAYRKAAMKYHPDRNPDDAEAEQMFKECSEAFEALSDPEKRQRYDQFGHEGLRGAGMHDFSGMGAQDIFSMFGDLFGDMGGFGGGFTSRGGGGGGNRPTQGYSLETQVSITLEDVLKGTTQEVSFTRQDNCEVCGGTGAKPGTKPETCPTCQGRGQVMVQQAIFQMVRTCPTCQGTGTIIKEKCTSCGGTGRKPKKRVIEIKIPQGISDGQTIRVGGEGEPGNNGGPHGDLHVVVRVKHDKTFQRNGDDLVIQKKISFTQATLGAPIEVPTLEGTEQLQINRGTQHGETYLIKGQGLPNLRAPGKRGDLVVQVLIDIPKKLNEQQDKLLREFAETEGHEVLPPVKGFFDKLLGKYY